MIQTITVQKLDKGSISEFSHISRSRDSDLYINPGQSPFTRDFGKQDDSSSSGETHFPSSNIFIIKRRFLNRKVPVVRRIPKLPIASQDLKIEEAEPVKGLLSKGMSFNTFPQISEKKHKEEHIPIYEYQRFRFEETCKKINEIRNQDLAYKTQRLLKTSQAKERKNREKQLFFIKKFSEYNFEQNKILKEKSRNAIQHEQKFLPARRRLKNFFVNQLV
jgi:hypothetical protein